MSLNPVEKPSRKFLPAHRFLVVTGFLLGVLAATLSYFAIQKSADESLKEVDQSASLASPSRELSKVALRPWSKEEIADELKVNGVAGLDEISKEFAGIIQNGVYRVELKEECQSGKKNQSFCWAVDDYFERQGQFFSSSRGPRKPRVLIEKSKVAYLQKEDFASLVSRIPDWDKKRLKEFSALALQTQECPRSFSLALSRKWEIHLDREVFEKRIQEPEGIWALMRQLESHGLECLKPDDPAHEFGFFRGGLWDVTEGKWESAAKRFDQALKSSELREEYRILYWLRRSKMELSQQTGDFEETEKYLLNKFPISWFTLLIQAQKKIDPLEQFAQRPSYSDILSPKEDMPRKRFFWLLALLESPDPNGYTIKRYGEYFIRLTGNNFEPGFFQFLARTFDRFGFHRLQILTLSQVAINFPDQVTLETLRLLFPMPFFAELDRASPKLDTALLLGLARQESGFDPTATSGVNARGLLQVLPTTARDVRRGTHKDELYELEKNVEVGSRFFMRLLKLFEGSAEKSLAAYNAGQGTLKKWERRYAFVNDPQLFLDLMPYRETRDYVPSILRNAYWYHRLFPIFTEKLEANSLVTSELLINSLKQTRGP